MTSTLRATAAFLLFGTLFTLPLLASCIDTSDDGSSSECTSPNCNDDDRRRRDAGTDVDIQTDGQIQSDASPDGEVQSDAEVQPDAEVQTDIPVSDGTQPCGIGRIEGRVCAPSEQVWIGGADVVITGIDCDGVAFSLETTSDSDGYFTFPEVPSGLHTIRITKGSFEAEIPVNVRPGETTDLVSGAEKACLIDEDIRIAVVTGTYDRIEDILDALGLEYDLFSSDVPYDRSAAEDFLLNPAALANYDIVMINCGEQYYWFGFWETDPTFVHRQMGLNLKNFVLDGGSLYVSDLAYFLIEAAFPEAFEFSDNESNYEAGLRGAITEIPATVVDPGLEAALGQTAITLDFALQGWAVVQAMDPSAVALVEGDAPLLDGGTIPDAPLLVSYQPTATSGRIFFTSFHNEAQLAEDIQRVLHHVIFSL